MPRGPVRLMRRVYKYVLPEVRSQLSEWRRFAERIPNPELRKQALDSMTTKQFHCEGGAVYAAADIENRHILIPLIVAFQTISDYLDNLCDRSTSLDPADFRRLHQSMLDSIDPDAVPAAYYQFRDEQEDGGYLRALVEACQSRIRMLPSYSRIQPYVAELVGLYCDLQVYKHIRKDLRETELIRWWEQHKSPYPDLYWNEFAAAAGSTLGVFMLFLAAADPNLDEDAGRSIQNRYFPYVCGLHILLDYLIDQEEDRIGGDLNFCNYYDGADEMLSRLAYFVERARTNVAGMEHSQFHRMIIEGLLALYLSDPKIYAQSDVRNISNRFMRNSPMTRLFFWANSVWIRKRQS